MQESLYNRYLRPDQSFYTLLTGRKPKKGGYGIEIEVEGNNLPHEVPGWAEHQDGSLRGESTEYVFAAPLDYDASVKKLTELEKAFKDNKSKLDFSYRTSIHVHVNVSELNLVHIANFITMYFILEDVLFDFAGRDRAGNLFCLRGCDAQGLIQNLISSVKYGQPLDYLNTDQIRYSALNPKALVQHGSLEVRSFRGTEDFDAVRQWLTILHQIRHSVDKFEDPQKIVFGLSALGSEGFIRNIFDKDISELFLKRPRLHQRMLEGVRLIQDFAFCIPDWTYQEPQKTLNEYIVRDANRVEDALQRQMEAPPPPVRMREIGERDWVNLIADEVEFVPPEVEFEDEDF